MMCFWFQLYKYLLSTIFLKILRKELKLKSLFHYYAKRIFPIHHISKQKVQVNIKLVQSTGKQWGAYHLHKQQCRSAGHLTTILSSGRIYSLVECLFHGHHSIPQTDQHSQASQHIHKTTSLFLHKAKEGIKDLSSLPRIPRIPKLVSLGFPDNLASFKQFWRGSSLRLLVKETHQGKPNRALPIAADYFCHFNSLKALNLLPTSRQHGHREVTEVQSCIL